MVQLCARIPHVTSIHGTDIHIIHKYSIMKPLIKFIAHFSNAITANSNHTFRLLKKNIGVQNKIIRKIPMGINIQEYAGIKPFKNTELKTVLFVGRLIAWKGISNLIKAIKIVQSKNCHVELIIIGEGPKRFELEKLANELSISSNTHFYGNINREKLYQSYKSADVLVLPSTIVDGQTEGLGVVLLEAMASGTPVIGSNTGGIPDIIEDGVNGLLVTPGDPQALADAIIRILENPDLAERFRKAGQETVRDRFSWDVITDQFVEVYQEILKESHHE
jgi:glycosyltransferase involved in cell wall biosynthesis